MADDRDRLMTLAEVADYLGLSRGSLYQRRHIGNAPRGFRVGASLRFRRSEVDQWLEQRRDEPRENLPA